MTFRQRLGLGAGPLIMRLVLGTVFVWAGSSKLFVTDAVTPEQAAMYANIGVLAPSDASAPPALAPPDAAVPEADPEPIERDTPIPDLPVTDEETEEGAEEEVAGETVSLGAAVILAQNDAIEYTADDFPNGAEVRRLHSLALLLHARSHPAEGPALWPAALGSGTMLTVMPWLAAITEFVGGIFIIVGLLTRLSALSLAGVMGVALLLTSIGPAAISGDGFLGFLPDPQFQNADAWVAAWQPMLFQLTTGALALSLFCTGGGWLSLDRALFGARTPSTKADEPA